MPRSPDEQRRRARKYGRRHRLGEARHSRKALDAVVRDLLRELSRSGVEGDKAQQLRATLKSATDDRRRGAAIWAIVDALEEDDRKRGR